MEIQLINKSADWLNTIWASIRTCKSGKGPIELFKDARNTDYDKKLRLVCACKNAGHTSVFEHVSMTFAVEGVSRALLAQYTRHRHLSFSVQSQRYVNMSDAKFVIPPSCDDFPFYEPTGVYKCSANMEHISDECKKMYSYLIDRGMKPEDARFVLPNGIACNFMTSMNLRSFMELYEKRVSVKGAQWEIRSMVERMAELIVETEPWTEALFE